MSVLVVTANPSLDRILRVQKVTPGSIHRSPSAKVSAGGKGLNVSRALQCISNKHVINSGILGGHPGKYLQSLAEQEGLQSNWYWLRESNNVTRTCVLVSDAHHDSTVFNEEGPTIDADEWIGFVQHISSIANNFEIIIFSGSLPLGVDPTSFSSFIHELSNTKTVIVDVSKEYLSKVLANPSGVHIKVNHSEFSQALQIDDDLESITQKSVQIINEGAKSIVVTFGSQGALLVNAREAYFAESPPVNLISTVGCGDTFTAAYTLSLLEHYSAEKSLAFSVACASASAENDTPGHLDIERAKELNAKITVNLT